MVQFCGIAGVDDIELGLVGIPCYGTISALYDDFNARLGLVGIPCYGTIRGSR